MITELKKKTNKDAIRIAWELGRRAIWDNRASYYTNAWKISLWHEGHSKHCLIEQWLNMDKYI